MGDLGWRDFLAAESLGDWVVLHGGATAVFRVLSLGEAARLADAVPRVPGIDGEGVLADDDAVDPYGLVPWHRAGPAKSTES